MLATRALTAADLPAMEALHEAAKCDAPIGIETIGNGDAAKFLTLAQRVLLAEDFQLFGAFYNDELVGVGAARHVGAEREGDKSTVHIEVLYVRPDRKSTRLNSSHVAISYAVFCLKKKIN